MIREFLDHRDSSRLEEALAFCQARIGVVNSDPDRAKALGWVLRLDAPLADEQIMRWAILQLFAMESPEADAILDR